MRGIKTHSHCAKHHMNLMKEVEGTTSRRLFFSFFSFFYIIVTVMFLVRYSGTNNQIFHGG